MPNATLLDLTYTYDGNGNRLEKQGTAPAINAAGQRDVAVTYQYNVKNQLLQETYSGETVQYEYDKVGNRICKTDANGVETSFTYDPQGSMIREDGPSGVAYYEYNPLNQQTKVVKPNQDVQVNRYDPEGLRAEMQENGKLVRFLFHKDEILVETDEENKPVSRFVRGYGVESLDQDGYTYYYHKDEQRSTSFITSSDDEIQNVYDYDAFGVLREGQESIDNRITYTGQQYDGISGQYYLRARYYNPVLGRFMQEDVYRGDGLNLYAYCDNNPVVYYDPSGYACEDKNKVEENIDPNKDSGKSPIEAYEVTTYEDFAKRSVVGDGLEGHEIWQHANLNEQGLATTRLSTDASKQNIVIALPHEVHVDVNRAQSQHNARTQTPIENINANVTILTNNSKIPQSSVLKAQTGALQHVTNTIKKGN